MDYPQVNGRREYPNGERGIGGTRVFLDGTDASGNRLPQQVSVTSADGFYQFLNLPAGTYTVREEQPLGAFFDGFDTVGTVGGVVRGTGGNDILSAVTLNAGDAGVEYNFGEIPAATVFGYVWEDTDNLNGIFDAGEPPIPNVAVTISGVAFAGTPLERPLTAADVPGGLTVLTNAVGRYEFAILPPGVYTLTETQPADYDDWMEQNGDPYGAPPAITNDVFGNVVLTGGQIRGPLNYGEIVGEIGQPPRQGPQVPSSTPSKRDFLGSTAGTGSAAGEVGRQAGQIGVADLPTQPFPGLTAPVTALPINPLFAVSTGDLLTTSYVVTGTGPGTAPLVRVFDYSTGLERYRIPAYENAYTGGVRVATGDVNGDGVADVITATGVGGGPRVRVFDGGRPQDLVHDFFAYEPTYTGGVSLAVGDVNGDGVDDLVTGADLGGGPRVRVLDGRTLNVIQDFFAFDPNQRGGVRLALADFTGDGRDDVVATTGAGVATRVRVFDAATFGVIREFAPYAPTFTGGAFVAAGDFDGDGTPDIVTGADAGGGPHVQVFSGATGASLASFFAFERGFAGGVRVAALDVTGDGRAEVVTGAGPGGAARVSIYSGPGINLVDDFYAYDIALTGGVYVGAGSARRDVGDPTGGDPVAAGQLGLPGTLPPLP